MDRLSFSARKKETTVIWPSFFFFLATSSPLTRCELRCIAEESMLGHLVSLGDQMM